MRIFTQKAFFLCLYCMTSFGWFVSKSLSHPNTSKVWSTLTIQKSFSFKQKYTDRLKIKYDNMKNKTFLFFGSTIVSCWMNVVFLLKYWMKMFFFTKGQLAVALRNTLKNNCQFLISIQNIFLFKINLLNWSLNFWSLKVNYDLQFKTVNVFQTKKIQKTSFFC